MIGWTPNSESDQHGGRDRGRTTPLGCVRDLRQDVTEGPPDDIRLSFNEAAEIYDRVRPSYPANLFDALFQMLPAEPEIVEIGPGTGQATKDLLARAASVHAVEIGPAMAAKLRSNLPSTRLRVTVGDFEVMTIVPRTADAVFSATAFHWISRGAQRATSGCSVVRPSWAMQHAISTASATYAESQLLTNRGQMAFRARPNRSETLSDQDVCGQKLVSKGRTLGSHTGHWRLSEC